MKSHSNFIPHDETWRYLTHRSVAIDMCNRYMRAAFQTDAAPARRGESLNAAL